MLKISLLFRKFSNFHGKITREFLGLRMRNFRLFLLYEQKTYREIFKSALVYL